MKIAIAVPVYGVEQYIARCATSLFEQTYSNIEYIFVNDCTPDSSVAVLNSVVEKYPNRKEQVKIVSHEKNRGLAAARNTALENCTSDYIMHVDSDDYIDVRTVELLVDKLKEDDYDIISYNFKVLMKSGDEIWKHPECSNPKEMTLSILKRNVPVCACGRLIRTALYKDNGIKTIEKVNMSEDYSVTPFLFFYSKKIATISAPLYIYDFRNESSYTHSISANKVNQDWQAVEHVESFFAPMGQEYVTSIKYAKMLYLYRQLIDLSMNNTKENTELFYKLRAKLSGFTSDDIKMMPFSVRIVLMIRNIYILKAFVKIVRFFK
ncbi:MAG: glycosyltransferase family 2 protein [Bacteroidaceae bacterium]|nr:glycosyltransferase family 2 protein [Bacteroidaceae bacterium]